MFKLRINIFIFLLVLAKITVLECKTNDEIQDVDSVKNSTSSTNMLSSHTQTSAPSISPSSMKGECKDEHFEDISSCPSGVVCSNLGGDCLDCKFNCSCNYGEVLKVICEPKKGVECIPGPPIIREMTCQYCYQTPSWEHNCAGTADCYAINLPRKMSKTNCSVKSEVICLGNRKFPKRIPCNWTSGYQWSTALILSITLGGFGADRFYLGHWQEGIGKLFSFGGLGVWTIIDVILIAIRYLGPANESLYI